MIRCLVVLKSCAKLYISGKTKLQPGQRHGRTDRQTDLQTDSLILIDTHLLGTLKSCKLNWFLRQKSKKFKLNGQVCHNSIHASGYQQPLQTPSVNCSLTQKDFLFPKLTTLYVILIMFSLKFFFLRIHVNMMKNNTMITYIDFICVGCLFSFFFDRLRY